LSQRVLVVALVAAVSLGAVPGTSARPVNLDRTVFVSPVPGNPVASGARLISALAGITGASEADPWLVKIEPGSFDLDGRSLAMKPYVDVEGSGVGVTVVRSTVEAEGTVKGADFSELRALTVWNTAAARAVALSNRAVSFVARGAAFRARGGSEFSSAVSSTAAGGVFIDVDALAEDSPIVTGMSSSGGLLHRVRASATGGTRFAYGLFTAVSRGEVFDVQAYAQGDAYAVGIRNEGGAPLLRNVRAIGRGANISEGIVNGAGSAALLQDVTIEVTQGADFAAGIRNEFSSMRLTGAVITVDGAGDVFGVVSSFSGTPAVANATLTVRGAGTTVGVQADGTQTTVESSRVESGGIALRNTGLTASTSIRVGASRVQGSVDPGAGTLRCVGSHDGSFDPLGADCVP
jgi:hypothetical protein